MKAKTSAFSAAESEALARRVREELARRRMTRQGLADAAKISISTLEKVLAGRRTLTLSTLIRLEEGLGTKLVPAPHLNGALAPAASETAPEHLGSYSRASVKWLEGAYLTLRPSFGEKGALYSYRTDVVWDPLASALVFKEAERVDADYTQFGSVAVPHQSGHIYFVTNRHGQHRLIVVARPTIGGELHGILTTLQSGKGAHLSPVATPIVMKPLKGGERIHYGRIPQSNSAHAGYAALLRKTLSEQFASFLPG